MRPPLASLAVLCMTILSGRSEMVDTGVRRANYKRTKFHVSADGQAQGYMDYGDSIRREPLGAVARRTSPSFLQLKAKGFDYAIRRFNAVRKWPRSRDKQNDFTAVRKSPRRREEHQNDFNAVRKSPRRREEEQNDFNAVRKSPRRRQEEHNGFDAAQESLQRMGEERNHFTGVRRSPRRRGRTSVTGDISSAISSIIGSYSNHTTGLMQQVGSFKPLQDVVLFLGVLMFISTCCCACVYSQIHNGTYRSRHLQPPIDLAPELTPEEAMDIVVGVSERRETAVFSNYMWQLDQGCSTVDQCNKRENWLEWQIWIGQDGMLYCHRIGQVDQRDQQLFDAPMRELKVKELTRDATCFEFAVSVEPGSQNQLILASERKYTMEKFLRACSGRQRGSSSQRGSGSHELK